MRETLNEKANKFRVNLIIPPPSPFLFSARRLSFSSLPPPTPPLPRLAKPLAPAARLLPLPAYRPTALLIQPGRRQAALASC